ncbi:MAG: N-6 DNA methylase [Ruminiclostridium sp.]|nr:N-6 DNA methylase [Ruminiclostridium sp.]
MNSGTFSRKDFRRVINSLKTLYRQSSEIRLSDETSIDLTIAMITLKMLAARLGTDWSALSTADAMLGSLDDAAKNRSDIYARYSEVFRMTDKDGRHIVFDFRDLAENEISHGGGLLTGAHGIIAALPDEELSFDVFGDVYESLAGNRTRSALGQFFTPRHIIRAIVRMFFSPADIKDIIVNRKTVADCCCGTGGFLTETFRYMKDLCAGAEKETDISELAGSIFVGYDIDANSIARAKVNMALAGGGFSDIRKLNTLTDIPKMKDCIDFIVTNVPYGKGDFAYSDPDSDYGFLRGNSIRRLETSFLLKITDMLRPGGRAAVIVPEGILEVPALAQFREYLLERCAVEAVISLPAYAFASYTKWKTYVLFLRKRDTGLSSVDDVIAKNENVWAYIVDNDGYANSDKRFRTGLTDENGAFLHDELSPYCGMPSVIEQHFREKDEDTVMLWKNEWNEEIHGRKYGYINIHGIAEKKTAVYDMIKNEDIGSILKNEAEQRRLLTEDEHILLCSMLKTGRKGIVKPKKKDLLSDDGELLPEYGTILDAIGIQYDAESGRFFDLNRQHTVYSLPLAPERYFRNRRQETVTLEELTAKTEEIKAEIKKLFGDAAL